MTVLYQYLCDRLSHFGYTAWAADAVPPDAPFPYVTLRILPPAPMQGSGRIEVTGWHRSSCPHRDRLAMADALLKIVPGAGLKVKMGSSMAVIHPADRLAAEWPESTGMLGVRILYSLRIYGQ